jgi:hypothetical protein
MDMGTLATLGNLIERPRGTCPLSQETRDEIDRTHEALTHLPPAHCPLTHLFTPGIYFRKIFMPAMSMVISKIHKTEHPFVILKGTVSVKNGDDEPIVYEAPYVGVTRAGTQRVLFCHTDVEWATIHATDKQNAEEILDEIIEYHANPYLENALTET